MKWKYFSMVTKVSHHYKKKFYFTKKFHKTATNTPVFCDFFSFGVRRPFYIYKSLKKNKGLKTNWPPPPLCICKRQTNNKFGQRYLLLSKLFRATWERRHQYNLLIQSHMGKENEKVWAMFNPKKSSKVVKIKLIRLTVTSITTAPPLTVRNQKNQYL